MCGIAGEYAFSPDAALSDAAIERMVESIHHRGPDQQAYVRRGNAVLGVTRLSIIDLEGSSQPLSNETRNLWLVFNGEIYNFTALRTELERAGHVFATRGDGEVIVHGYEEWGVGVLAKLRGMFAFALWDEQSEQLLLARDRMGIKPLYLHRDPSRFMFASEAKALFAAGVKPEPRPEMLDCYLALRYIPAPETMFRGVDKLRPGHYALVSQDGVRIEAYARLHLTPKQQIAEEQARSRLLELLRRSVEYRLQSDVALGVFLSGGLDSGFLVALTREQHEGPLDTFSIGFNRPGVYNEIPAAEVVSRRYRTNQHSVVIDHREFARQLPDAVRSMDEPMADPSSVPMRILSMEAKKHVKVVLSGEGADELFAGYGRYVGERFAGRLPLPQGLAAVVARLLRGRLSRRSLKAIEGLAIRDPRARHLFWQTIVPAEYRHALLDGAGRPQQVDPIEVLERVTEAFTGGSQLDKLFFFDLRGWLVDDLLQKKDKMGMSASIEARVPYLDQDVVEFAATLPDALKVRGLQRKYLFRKVIVDYLPDEILRRPKVGFAVPLADWFRHELKEFVRDYVTAPGGFLDDCLSREARRSLLDAHLRGEDLSLPLYSLLVLELWGRLFCRGESAEAVSGALQTTLH
jgi:asparagine synthase (glutamine-hydrolysing)